MNKRRNPASRTKIYGKVEYSTPSVVSSVVASRTLANGVYKGIRFKVLMNHGISPSAYISLDKKQEIIVDILEHLVHGGITFRYDTLKGDYARYQSDGRRWIGWDYSHVGDYNPIVPTAGGRQWTTEEIVVHVKNIVDAIKLIEKGQPKDGQDTHTATTTSTAS